MLFISLLLKTFRKRVDYSKQEVVTRRGPSGAQDLDY